MSISFCSGNGTYFFGAQAELNQNLQQTNQKRVSKVTYNEDVIAFLLLQMPAPEKALEMNDTLYPEDIEAASWPSAGK
ncbi:hypothetical protein CSKR_200047 [Clonorchis sinensis]|uniref:Uncharacterized protein n=1 Tax=Clonorchis sinensis TaxID=79923 RepID=A0A8T1LYJ5_CLOSI|nr:hypothetical protein CSKR_200047 [Clonorchis sinensis]